MSEQIYVGRRKSAVARVRIRRGSGQYTLNGRPLEDYFRTERLRAAVLAPFALLEQDGRWDVIARINGGGVTGAKGEQKMSHHHSGYPGGLKSVPFARMLDERPERAVEKAITGMLPKNRLGRAMAKKLKVYAGSEHPHAAQQPRPLP